MDYRWGLRRYDLVHFAGSYLEVDVGDTRSVNRILDVISGDGTLQLHLPIAQPPVRYSVGTQTLIFLFGMC